MDTNPVASQSQPQPEPVHAPEAMPLPPRKRKERTDIDRRALLAGAGLLGAAAFARSARADLDPPVGPITASMKSLREVEPRTPVSVQSLPGNNEYMCIIQQQGSYMLTAPLLVSAGKGGILVAVPSGTVSIDMCEFGIRGTGQGTRGGIAVESAGLSCLEVCNGFIRDLAGTAIDSGGARVLDCYDLHIDNCAQGIVCRSTGLVEACHVERCVSHGCSWLKSASSVSCCFYCDDCEFRACGGHGVCMIGDWSQGDASFCVCDTDCVQCGLDGIHLTCVSGGGSGTPPASCTGDVVDCRCVGNGGHGHRMSCTSPSSRCAVSIMDCMCNGNLLGGMRCASMCVDMVDCTCCDNNGPGIDLDTCASSSCECCMSCRNSGAGMSFTHVSRCSVDCCSSHSNGGAGVSCDFQCTQMCMTENDCSGNPTGFSIQSPSCLCLWNTASGNTQNFAVAPGAPVVVVSGGELSTNTCPHCNYSMS